MHGSFEFKTKSDELNAEVVIDKVFGFVLRNWKILVSATLFSIGFAFVFLMTSIPIYVASTQILLDTRRERSTTVERTMSDFNYDSISIENMITVLQSSELLKRVVREQRLYEDPEFNFALIKPAASLFENIGKLPFVG